MNDDTVDTVDTDDTEDTVELPDAGEDIYLQLTRALGYEPCARREGGSVSAVPDEPSTPAQRVPGSRPVELRPGEPGQLSPDDRVGDLAPPGQEPPATDPEGRGSPLGHVPPDEHPSGAADPEEDRAGLTTVRSGAPTGPGVSEFRQGAAGSPFGAGPRPVEGPAESPDRDRSAEAFYARLPDPPPIGASG